MQRIGERWVFSISDVNDFLACEHLVELERGVAHGELAAPELDDATRLIREKGELHERAYFERLRAAIGDAGIADLSAHAPRSIDDMQAAQRETLDAMRRGTRIIYQAAVFDGAFYGRVDFLRRIDVPSEEWSWSYEVLDTKLALSTKPAYLVQLCHYSEQVSRLQGRAPEHGYVVLGNASERRFRIEDYSAYYRHARQTFLDAFAANRATYPSECAQCRLCRWEEHCSRRRDDDDHLSIVAFMRNDQIEKLEGAGIATVAALARASDEQRPHGVRPETFATLRAQAALQHRQRTIFTATGERRYFYEFLDRNARAGFEAMPLPDPGDVFFDMEGDPLYSPEHGLEYLFGVYLPHEDSYRAFWARSEREERAAFEAFVDFIVARRARFANLHIYHYAPYEQTALRRLMGVYGTREREIDELLAERVFVDLYAVTRQALRISQPRYSIKQLEPFYGMTRATNVRRGDDSIVMFETWLSSGDDAILDDIERYNRDDCRSTYLLREWLLERRAERERTTAGDPLLWRAPGRAVETSEANEPDTIAERLLAGIAPPLSLPAFRGAADDVRARWLLGHLLEYHRREAKPNWWKLFDRYENRDRLIEFDHEAIGGLRLRTDIAPAKLSSSDRNFVYTYEFPEQQHHLGTSTPHSPDHERAAGKIVEIDTERNLVRVKLHRDIKPDELRALIPGGPLQVNVQRAALRRIAQSLLDGRLASDAPATRDLLLAHAPRLRERRVGARIQPEAVTAQALADLVFALDDSIVFIQGPPGSGKSTMGAAMIVSLLAAKKRVGILASSHRAIHNLLDKIESEAMARGVHFTGLKKSRDGSEESCYRSRHEHAMIESDDDNAMFTNRAHDLAAGTAWLFAREELAGSYDYLVIDEAGQLSLADALACSLAARNVVLLGDPLQLAQVSRGSHPVGTDLSVLEHLLGDHATVPPERGVFLDVSHRMHPQMCRFISHVVYDDRLHAAPATQRNRVASPGLNGSGLRYLPVEHRGNVRSSVQEAAAIAREIAQLVGGRVTLRDAPERPMTQHDVLVLSPYNAQCAVLRAHLANAGLSDVRVGTVDKFQGQEAAVVFYSMATSSGDDLPRNLEFLFEKNRFNVALSRAQCMTVLVCSPRLLDVDCRHPEQMALVNLVCAYVEASGHSIDTSAAAYP